MDILPKRKCYNFRLSTRKFPKRSNTILNQSTIVGSLCNLMANEKVVVALLRIRDANESEKSVPVGFKIQENAIPAEVKPDRLHSANLVHIQVAGYKALPAMIACIGGDSKELSEFYSAFCERMKVKKLPNLANKINHWLSIKNIIVIRQSGSKMESITSKDFNGFIHHVENLAKLEKRTGEKEDSSKPKKQQAILEKPSSSVKAPTPNVSKSSSGYVTDSAEGSSLVNKDSTSIEDSGSQKDLLDSTMRNITKFQVLLESLSSFDPYRLLFLEVSQIHSNLIKLIQNIENKFENHKQIDNFDSGIQYSCDITIIDEEDCTRESGNITLIEGLLPVKTSWYKRAMTSLNADIQDREPSNVITTIAKTCFPDHWVSGVTLRGQGGKKSLLNLWNYEDPLTFPCAGAYNKQLGTDRLQALINNTMRKCGRKSYDQTMEKHLGAALAKAIHYKRTKVNSTRGWDQMETSDEDEDLIYTSDKDADNEEYEDADTYTLPKPKDRRFQTPVLSSRRSKNLESSSSKNSVNLSPRVMIPDISMVYESSPKHASEKDADPNKEKDNDEVANKSSMSATTVGADNENQDNLKEDNVGPVEKEDTGETAENENPGSPRTPANSQESLGFNQDDDDFLRDLNLGDEPDRIFSGSEKEDTNDSEIQDPQSKEESKEKEGTGDSVSKKLTSTPAKDNVVHNLSLKYSPIPGKSKSDTEMTESVGSESRGSDSNASKVDPTKKGTIDSYFPKRKKSALFDENLASKKSKNADQEPEVEKNDEKSRGSIQPSGSEVKENQSFAGTIDPMTLAFLTNPANAALLNRVSTSFKKSIETTKPKSWPGITRNFKNMQVFGKFKQPLKETSIEPIPSTSAKSSSQPSQQSYPGSGKSSSNSSSMKSSEPNESILSSQRMNQDTIHCITMAYWIVDDEKVQQPVLLKLKKVSFIENELVLPFSMYNSNTRNCFQFKVGNIDFHGKILSLGDNSEELKATFRRNSSANPDWKGLPKMVRMNDRISKFSHTPLKDKNNLPPYKILTEIEVKRIFHENIAQDSQINESTPLSSTNSESQKNKRTQEEIDRRSSSEEENDEEDSTDKNENHKISGKKAIKKTKEDQAKEIMTNKQKRMRNDVLEVDKTRPERIMEKLNSQINDIIQKKSIISSSETNGQVLITIINILDDLREFLDQNQQNELANANIVPEKDSTYKISQKGLIQLDLDLYEAAVKHAKANNPASFAYSLVKFSFPKSYIQDVVLGKKFYERSEFDEMLKSKEDENRKYPLSFIWGFKDPFNERMEGNFDYKLGNERIRAFINHTFRKSNIFSYSKEAESHVRRRIMKELCFLNAEISKKKAKEDIEDQESESGKSQESMIWDSDWFEKK
uniref:Uncharacterized protein n=1 Tax=Tetranychus urticae TaxID=32264 RepID=T1L6N4_TETUR